MRYLLARVFRSPAQRRHLAELRRIHSAPVDPRVVRALPIVWGMTS